MSRGLRNNNPGNLRHGSKWDGLSETQTDKDFCQFQHAVFGIRAMAKTLLTYERKYHLFTVPELISRYAPGVENDTESYINSVCQQAGFTRHQSLNLKQRNVMTPLIKAMIKHENGVMPYVGDEAYILQHGITLALEPAAYAEWVNPR